MLGLPAERPGPPCERRPRSRFQKQGQPRLRKAPSRAGTGRGKSRTSRKSAPERREPRGGDRPRGSEGPRASRPGGTAPSRSRSTPSPPAEGRASACCGRRMRPAPLQSSQAERPARSRQVRDSRRSGLPREMQPESVPSRKSPIMIGINAKLAQKILKATVLSLSRST